ncbi:TaqI-like C-terminal specificity domain-containing protein [Natrinema salsiterrestre]|uniref:site-specific DNA-methyltransferase (adenine-specific) n=1 Tax=Natrinema salsiterrestre TaxID=2950540 RepID=A0A9Q4KZD5_9EURY|nr:TaqI-like C-terminal specificity domain-containing protein [Natrinema salsiterrestre]MDF9745026.1 hypothetical protein [Natrinema salsiterrestre]
MEPGLLKPFLKGNDVHRYDPLEPRYWVIFPYHIDGEDAEFVEEEELEQRYPRTYEYLRQHEDDLRNREGGKMDHERWYDYVYPKNLTDFQKEKIITPEISYGPNFTYDSDGTYHTTKVYGLLVNDSVDFSPEYLLSVLNSPTLWFFLSNTGYTLRGGYFTFKTNYLNPFSVPQIPTDSDADSVEECQEWYEKFISQSTTEECPIFTEQFDLRSGTTHDFLGFLAEEIIQLKAQHDQLNLNILDYLGTYSNGQQLGELAEYQPPQGAAESIIAETSETRDSLRVGSIDIVDSGSKLEVKLTARYKPDDPEDFETDQWGYTETQSYSAMEFIGLSEEMKAIIKEFVPVAVEEAGGFANFRETATKTNSLIDRLKKTTLPAQDDVSDGIQRYLSTKNRAENIQYQIEKTDDLINRIVYALYGFEDDEVERIESTLEE